MLLCQVLRRERERERESTHVHTQLWCDGYRRRKWTRVQMLDEADCISHSINNPGKSRNPIMGK